MKIIKTAQLSGLLGKADQLVDAIDDASHLDPQGVELEIGDGVPAEGGHDDSDPGLSRSGDFHHDGHLAGDGSEGGEPFDDTDAVMGDGHDQMGGDPSLTLDSPAGDIGFDGGGDMGGADLSFDLGLDGPMEPGVGADLGDMELGDNGKLDIGVQVDPDPERGELPLDVEVEGEPLDIDQGMDQLGDPSLEDHNDPALGLDELGGDDATGQFDEMALDGQLDGQMDPHDLHNTAGGSELGNSPEPVDAGEDAGIDGLLVMDEGDDSHLPL